MAGFADGVYVGGPEQLAALTVAVGLWALVSGLFLAFCGRTQGLVYFMLIGGGKLVCRIGPVCRADQFYDGFYCDQQRITSFAHLSCQRLQPDIKRDRLGDARPCHQLQRVSHSRRAGPRRADDRMVGGVVRVTMGRREKRDYNVDHRARPHAVHRSRDRGGGSRIAEGISHDCAYPSVR